MKKFVFVLFVIFMTSCSNGEDMPVNIGKGLDKITVVNTDNKSFVKVRVKINSNYLYEFQMLEPREIKEIGLTSFIDKKGNRFIPGLVAVKDIYISGEHGGKKYWANFKPR